MLAGFDLGREIVLNKPHGLLVPAEEGEANKVLA
jgi:hypothetical protein